MPTADEGSHESDILQVRDVAVGSCKRLNVFTRGRGFTRETGLVNLQLHSLHTAHVHVVSVCMSHVHVNTMDR